MAASPITSSPTANGTTAATCSWIKKILSRSTCEPVAFDRRFDLAICLEVAEHVDGDHSDNIVRSLVEAAEVILFGAAIPLQGGFGHINEQWPSWWRAKFAALGYEAFDLVRPKFWADQSIHYWYRQNTFVYVRPNNVVAIAAATAAARTIQQNSAMFDAVHPEKFTETASYASLSLKRLAKRLPGWVVMRARQKLGSASH